MHQTMTLSPDARTTAGVLLLTIVTIEYGELVHAARRAR
jgi:hypothetical protein